jgi:hypothetical protein
MDVFDHLDYYGTLGLERNDSPSTTEIKEAYLRVSKVTHPDNSEGLVNPAWFAAATRARDTLLHHRHAYDSWLESGATNSSSPTPPTCDVSQRNTYAANSSERAHFSDDLYFSYLRSRSLVLFFVGVGVLYVDRIHPFATPHDFLRDSSLISWGLFWIVPKKAVRWLMKLPSHHGTSRSFR